MRIVSGDKVSMRLGQANPAVFQVTCKGDDSVYFNAFAQEKITKFKYLTSGKTLPDFDWVPKIRNGPGTNAFFYSSGGRISDNKINPGSVYLRNLPANTPLFSCHQDLRVSIIDPCGGLMAPIKLGGGYDITQTKDTQNQMGGTYIIIHE